MIDFDSFQNVRDFGYREIGRDIFLKHGKQNLGDIDLALHHDGSGHTLLVEGKGHALPLDVYFNSPLAIAAHLKRTRDWENKVQGRIRYLKNHNLDFKVTEPCDYIIVTLHPEMLSHVSSVMTLSIKEFQHWLASGRNVCQFSEFFENFYRPNEPTISEAEMQQMYEDGLVLARVAR
ncbi:hypothetical protein GBK02_01840 [Dechloromonas sp. TW-R-39-2]|uniref:hypothetical protein n=1 Tax=Dechloromonas sp. TW-R-39-2 TaxID=2654218 RepID=UPI00193CF90D|nr:hypothetical protein [Dechloromonas sp. TW-R-39-2]QRM18222.1 hypothetical protein GBK02_01840 [Dechloromonas sp. TW-R-39-2]